MSGNSKQRRTLRRALDSMKPWGRAVARERRKGKRNRRVSLARYMQSKELMPGFNARITADFKRAWDSAEPFDWNKLMHETRDDAPKLRHEASE